MNPLAALDVPGVQWSAMVRDHDGVVIAEHGADQTYPTASMGKVLLLLEAARQATTGEFDLDQALTRTGEEIIADSGIWHTLRIDDLPAYDVAMLVGAVSDNLATNVLLRRCGLERVDALRESLGLKETRLLDQVRNERGEGMPWTLSTACAVELSDLMWRIAKGRAVSPEADMLVRRWLSGGNDLIVAGGLGLDVLAHRDSDLPEGSGYWNKTGAETGIRADAGVLTIDGRDTAYAIIAHWGRGRPDITPQVHDAMRSAGRAFLGDLARP